MVFTVHVSRTTTKTNKTMTNASKVMKLMKQARNIKSPKHFQLLFGKFQSANAHLSVDLQDSANREFRRIAQAGWNRRTA